MTWCRLLTGQLPFPMGLRELQEKYPEIAVVLRRALEREPDKRFESVKAFANAINDAALNDLAEQAARTRSDSLVLAAPPLPRKVSYGIPSRRLPASWIVSGVLVALLLLLIGGLIVSVPLARLFVSSPTPTTSGSPVTLCLATDLPLNGTERVAGRAIRNGVELALAQSPLSKPYHGYIVRQDDMDDSSNDQAGQPDATAGIRNIQSLPTAACPQPIAIIGPVNSPLAVSEIPVAAANKILLLSPSNTAPCLTQPNWSDPPQCIYGLIHPQGFNTYARLPGTDIDQGYLDADLIIASKNTAHPAQGGLGAQKVEIVGDEEVYGTQVALAVIQEMKNKGLLPVGIDCLKPQDEFNSNPFCSLNQSSESFPLANIDSLARKIRDEQADAVFFGGRNDRGADRLRKALEELGLDNVPFIGADALVTEADAFFQTLGDQGSNVYATFPAVDPSTFISESGPAAEFFSRYQNKFGTSPESYSSNGFDAANIILQSIKTLIDSGKPVNAESVTRAVLSNDSGKDDFMGVVGNRIHFDQNGDNTGQRLYTVYQSQQTPQGTWNWGVLREQTSV